MNTSNQVDHEEAHSPRQSRQQRKDEGKRESDENTNATIEEKGKDQQYTKPHTRSSEEKNRKKSIL